MIAGSLVGTPSRFRAALRQVGIGPERTTAEVIGLLLAKAAAGFLPAIMLSICVLELVAGLLAPFGIEFMRPAFKAPFYECLLTPWFTILGHGSGLLLSGWVCWRITQARNWRGLVVWGVAGLLAFEGFLITYGTSLILPPSIDVHSTTLDLCAFVHGL